MLDPSLIRMAFYEGSDGPRLMLFGPCEAAFVSLQKCFRQLAQCGEGQSIDLERLPCIHGVDGLNVRLTSCGPMLDSLAADQGIRRKSGTSFEWKRTKAGWQQLGDLIEGLLNSDTPCHQYLSMYPNEDAIVVVSKGEYTDDVLEL